jgi:hypothetical protein
MFLVRNFTGFIELGLAHQLGPSASTVIGLRCMVAEGSALLPWRRAFRSAVAGARFYAEPA